MSFETEKKHVFFFKFVRRKMKWITSRWPIKSCMWTMSRCGTVCKDCMFFLVFIVEAKEDNDKLVGLLEKSEKMKEASMLFQIY